jgi:hypothetical protein
MSMAMMSLNMEMEMVTAQLMMFVGTAMMPDECRVASGGFLNICGEKASRRGSER